MLKRRSIAAMLAISLVAAACDGSAAGNEDGESVPASPGQVTTTSGSEVSTASMPEAPAPTQPEQPTTTQPEKPTTTLSNRQVAVELRQWRADAREVAEGYWGAWPDTAIVEELADDVVFSMPSDGDLIEGKAAVGSMLQTFIGYYAGAEPSVEAMFLSADAAAYHVSFASGLWPPWTPEPLSHPPFVILDVFRLTDGAITDYEVWLEDKTLEMAEYGCYAIGGCLEAQALVDRYMAAWAAGDVDEIAALYADDAVFTDSLLGIHAVGPDAISGLVDERYGSGDFTVELLGVYGQTNGHQSPTDESPDQGQLVGIGIHYRVADADTGAIVLESLTTFELGDWQPGSFNRHPRGLITREEVFHKPDAFR